MKKILKWGGFVLGLIAIIGGSFAFIETNKVHDYAAQLSPDGSKLVFYSYREGSGRIYLMDADGSNQKRIEYPETNGNDIEPYWSPDGSKISFTSQDGGDGLFMMNPDGSDLKLIVAHGNGYAHFGSWGLDGQHIYYYASDRPDGPNNVYRINVDGTNRKQLTNATSELSFNKPRVVLTGDSSLYTSAVNSDGMNAIFSMDLEGGNLMQITNFEDNFREPAPSPDGEELVFTSDRDGNLDVYIMDIESGAIKKMTNSNAREYFPTYSLDCSKIYFSARSSSGGEILSINSDGTMVANITKNTRYN